MENSLTQITLHGELGEFLGKNWELAVNSVGEALHAIQVLSKRKLYEFLKTKEDLGYKVIINGKEFIPSKQLDINDTETIKNSELCISFGNDKLKTIDIVPVIGGAGKIGGFLTIILGVVLIATGVFAGLGVGLTMAFIAGGIGLIGAGITNLLSKPPSFDKYQDFQSSRNSYLFNGPYNTIEEGGPVPVGYGELIVGSQVISTSYDISYFPADLTKNEVGEDGQYAPGDRETWFEISISTPLDSALATNSSQTEKINQLYYV